VRRLLARRGLSLAPFASCGVNLAACSGLFFASAQAGPFKQRVHSRFPKGTEVGCGMNLADWSGAVFPQAVKAGPDTNLIPVIPSRRPTPDAVWLRAREFEDWSEAVLARGAFR